MKQIFRRRIFPFVGFAKNCRCCRNKKRKNGWRQKSFKMTIICVANQNYGNVLNTNNQFILSNKQKCVSLRRFFNSNMQWKRN
jgi:hypothetical protein